MQFDVITLFPDFFTTPLNSGLLGKAFDKKIAKVNLVNPRDYTTDKYKKVDDESYGGAKESAGIRRGYSTLAMSVE